MKGNSLSQMFDEPISLIFKYAACFNGYLAFGGLEKLGEMANEKLFFFKEHGAWLGSARELRACLFIEERRWRHVGWLPEGQDAADLQVLFNQIQTQILEGDYAPNDSCERSIPGVPSVKIDGEYGRLLEWREDEGLIVHFAKDLNGEVLQLKCPPSEIKPDDPKVLDQVKWLFNLESVEGERAQSVGD